MPKPKRNPVTMAREALGARRGELHIPLPVYVLADALGVSRRTVTRWETDAGAMKRRDVWALLGLLVAELAPGLRREFSAFVAPEWPEGSPVAGWRRRLADRYDPDGF